MGLFDDVFGNKPSDPLEQKRRHVKAAILDRFVMADLKKILSDYGVGEPPKVIENFFMVEKRTLTRDHYIEHAMSKLKLDQIVAFCDKRKIKIQDLVAQLEPPKAPVPTPTTPKPAPTMTSVDQSLAAAPAAGEFEAILADIQNNFEPEDIRSEEDLEKQLVQRLKILHPGAVERQVPTPKGKIDVVLKSKYALEIKIADRVSLRNLIGQAHTYKKLYEHMAVVIVDTGRISRSDLAEFVKDYADLGIKSVVLDGVRHKPTKKGRGTTIRIN